MTNEGNDLFSNAFLSSVVKIAFILYGFSHLFCLSRRIVSDSESSESSVSYEPSIGKTPSCSSSSDTDVSGKSFSTADFDIVICEWLHGV